MRPVIAKSTLALWSAFEVAVVDGLLELAKTAGTDEAPRIAVRNLARVADSGKLIWTTDDLNEATRVDLVETLFQSTKHPFWTAREPDSIALQASLERVFANYLAFVVRPAMAHCVDRGVHFLRRLGFPTGATYLTAAPYLRELEGLVAGSQSSLRTCSEESFKWIVSATRFSELKPVWGELVSSSSTPLKTRALVIECCLWDPADQIAFLRSEADPVARNALLSTRFWTNHSWTTHPEALFKLLSEFVEDFSEVSYSVLGSCLVHLALGKAEIYAADFRSIDQVPSTEADSDSGFRAFLGLDLPEPLKVHIVRSIASSERWAIVARMTGAEREVWPRSFGCQTKTQVEDEATVLEAIAHSLTPVNDPVLAAILAGSIPFLEERLTELKPAMASWADHEESVLGLIVSRLLRALRKS